MAARFGEQYEARRLRAIQPAAALRETWLALTERERQQSWHAGIDRMCAPRAPNIILAL